MKEHMAGIAKETNTQILWKMISDVAEVMRLHTSKPDYEISRADKQVSETWYELFTTLVCEADDRFKSTEE